MIYIDATHIRWTYNHGTEEYLFCILSEMRSLGVDFTLFVNSKPSQRFLELLENSSSTYRVIPFGRQILFRVAFQQLILPLMVYKRNLLCPAYIAPIFHYSRVVLVIHDMYAWSHPRDIGIIRSLYWRFVISISSMRARRIICISSETYSRFNQFLPIAAKRSLLCSSGAPPKVSCLEAIPELKGDFILCVGLLKTVKNPYRAYRAFCKFNRQHNLRYRLVITGRIQNEWRLKSLVRELRRDPYVFIAGYVKAEQLGWLYTKARMLLFPSLAEGFGLPILEARQYNCRVVTSDRPPMLDLGGNSAEFCNPYSENDIIYAMNRALNRSILQFNQAVSDDFSWMAHVKTLLSQFEPENA